MRNMSLIPMLLIFIILVYGSEVNISVPSFPKMCEYFHTKECVIQWTLSMNYLGLCLSGFFYGPLSDSFGRKKLSLISAAIFAIGSIGCALSNSITTMLIARFIQGLGASGGIVIVYAIIADLYSKQKATHFIGIMNAVLTIFMSIAPTLGSLLIEYFNWRANFTLVATLAVITFILVFCLLPETLPDKEKKIFKISQLWHNYKKIMLNRTFVIYSIVPCFTSGAYFTFLVNSPFIYVDVHKISQLSYSLHMAAMVGSFSIISFFAGTISRNIGIIQSVLYGNIITFIIGIIILLLSIINLMTPMLLTVLMAIGGIGAALIVGNAAVICLGIDTVNKGLISSGLLNLRFVFCAIIVTIGGSYYNGFFMPLAILLFICYTISLVILLFDKRLFDKRQKNALI